ncbi:MAG: NUDIX domain-containing protein [Candidatus Aenigmatarchaeota archaeon]|nr:NUDIX domain-containing protein [Candidatus Aenigmarchaeota archaeon]
MRLNMEQKKAITLNQRLMVTALIKRGNRYLLIKRSALHKVQRGKWQFPEGGVEFGERPLAALKRELKEETNLHIKKAELLGLNSYVVRMLHTEIFHIIRIIYLVSACGKLKLSSEHSEAGWFTKKQIAKMPLMWINFNSIQRMIP